MGRGRGTCPIYLIFRKIEGLAPIKLPQKFYLNSLDGF